MAQWKTKNIFLIVFLLFNGQISAQTNTDLTKHDSANSIPNSDSNSTPAITSISPPEGFENLNQPQTTLVDVYYNKRLLGSFLASYTIETLSFQNPNNLTDAIPDLLDADLILLLLSNPLDTHSELLCFYEGQQNCGTIETENLAIIFDENEFRVDIFIHPNLRQTQKLSINRYLPSPSDEFSMLHNFRLAFSHTNENNASGFINSTYAYQNMRLNTLLETQTNKNSRFRNLSLQYETKKFLLETGSFRSSGDSAAFFSEKDIIGFRVATTFNSRTDLDQVEGTPIVIFLNVRSLLEIYKDGRLIDSRTYQAGNQTLDTRFFPDGSYNIKVKIIEPGGTIRDEERFFVKTSYLPPLDEPGYFFEAGFLKNQEESFLPHYYNEPLIRLGGAIRLNNNFGLQSLLTATDQQVMTQLGTYLFWDGLYFNSNYAMTDDKNYAFSLFGNYQYKRFSSSFSYRKITSQSERIADEINIYLLPQSRQEASLNFRAPIYKGYLDIFSRFSENSNSPKVNNIGFRYRYPIFYKNKFSMDFISSYTKENNNKLFLLGFQIRYINSPFQASYQGNYKNNKLQSNSRENLTSQFYSQQLRLNYSDRKSLLGELNHNLNLLREDQRNNIAYRSHLYNRYGEAQFEWNHISDTRINNNEQAAQNNYNINSRFTIASNKTVFTFGGHRTHQAGVMIRIDDDNKTQTPFEVMINKIPQPMIISGTTSLIPLSPYQTYSVKIIPKGDRFINFDSAPKQVTVYPGNIPLITWKIYPVFVVIGQLFDEQQNAIGYGRIEGALEPANTDENAWFQIEIGANKKLQVFYENKSCTVDLSHLSSEVNIHFVDDINCLP